MKGISIKSKESTEFSDPRTKRLFEWGYEVLSRLYNGINNRKLSDEYADKAILYKTQYINELNEINKIENELRINIVKKEIADITKVKDSIIRIAKLEMQSEISILAKLKDSLINLKNIEIQNSESHLKSLKDSLIKTGESLAIKNNRIILLDKEIVSINQRLAEKERQLGEIERLLGEKENLLSGMKTTLSRKQQTLNYTAAIAAILILIGSFTYIKFYRARQKNKRLEDEKTLSLLRNKNLEYENAMAQLRISNQQLKNHEFKDISFIIKRKASLLFSSFSNNQTPQNKENIDELLSLVNMSELAYKYIEQYHNSSKETNNTINGEFELANSYTNIFKMMYRLNVESIKLSNLIKDDFVKNELLVPTHLINNFIINSLKHGLQGQDAIEVIIESENTSSGYKIIIDDNGCGITQSKKLKKRAAETGTGIQLAINAINAYNDNVSNKFQINFTKEHHLIDKTSEGNGKGTKVIIDFIKR